jgi:hypothetical protein
MYSSELNRTKGSAASGAFLPILLAVLLLLSSAVCSSARSAKGTGTATLVETETYIPCRDGCSTAGEPARAFCFRLGDEFLVGEGRSYFHEDKFTRMEDLAGKQVPIRFSRRSLWIRPTDRAAVKIGRGSRFEEFKDSGCIREVHRPILALAASSRRPAKVPGDAIAIAGPGRGEFQPLFLWFQCGVDSDPSAIACRTWYRNGEPAGTDWYCAQRVDGAPVDAKLPVDPLLSRAGRLVLTSGAVLPHDSRGRINGQLEHPGVACY